MTPNGRIPVPDLFKDPMIGSNCLESFLAGPNEDGADNFFPESLLSIVSTSSISRQLYQAVEESADPDKALSSWITIQLVCANLPPRADLLDRIASMVLKTDFAALVRENLANAVLALNCACSQSVHLSNPAVLEHLKEQLLSTAAAMRDLNPPEREIGFVVNAAFYLSTAQKRSSEAVSEFSNLVDLLLENCLPMKSVCRRVVQSLWEDLPIAQAERLVPLLTKLRALSASD